MLIAPLAALLGAATFLDRRCTHTSQSLRGSDFRLPRIRWVFHGWLLNGKYPESCITRLRRCGSRALRQNRVPEVPSGKPRFRGLRGRFRSCRILRESFAAAIRLRGAESGSWTWSKSARRKTQPLARLKHHKP